MARAKPLTYNLALQGVVRDEDTAVRFAHAPSFRGHRLVEIERALWEQMDSPKTLTVTVAPKAPRKRS